MVPVALTPSIITRPAVGSSSPAMMLKIVLLPQPEGPIRLTKRPCGIASVTGASASKTPAGLLDVTLVLNVIPTSSTQSFGAGYDMHSRHPWRCTEIPPDPEARLAKAVPARKGRCTGDGSSSQRTDG